MRAASSLLAVLLACVASADGSSRAGRLAFLTSAAQSPTAALWISAPDGPPVRRCDVAARRLSWSPDGRLLAAWLGSGHAPGPIMLVDPATQDAPKRLVERGSEPCWSPDGKSLAFARDGGGIAVADVTASTVRDVAGSERGYAPAWAGDGSRLAFARSSGGAGSIWLSRLDGTAPTRLAFCARPLAMAWSPDGSRLAIVVHDAERMASPRLSVLRVGAEAPDTKATVRSERIAWMPDGQRIAIDGPTGPSLVDVGSGRVTALSDTSGVFAGIAGPDEAVELRGGTVRALRPGASARTLASAASPVPRGATPIDAAWSATAAAVVVSAPSVAAVPPDQQTQTPTVPADPATPGVVPSGIFPVIGAADWSDTFGAPRHGERKHQGQDIMAPKMRPVVACFAGIVMLRKSAGVGGHNWLVLVGDNGWTATYLHLNNDTPGTDDGLGTEKHAFAAGLATGTRVVAGQLLGWVGDSGNAEDTAPHLHFELAETGTGIAVNPAAFLRAAERIDAPRQTR